MDTRDLKDFIAAQGIKAQVILPSIPTPTVEAAAKAVDTTPDQIVKTLVFTVSGQVILVISCGTDRVDGRKIAAHYGVGRKRVKLADAATVLEATGYEVGAVPPFGHQDSLPVLLDRRVLEHTQVYAGGGARDTLLKVAPDEIVRHTGAVLLDVSPDR